MLEHKPTSVYITVPHPGQNSWANLIPLHYVRPSSHVSILLDMDLLHLSGLDSTFYLCNRMHLALGGRGSLGPPPCLDFALVKLVNFGGRTAT